MNISERTRTIILIILLLGAVAFIVWMRHSTDANFTNTFR